MGVFLGMPEALTAVTVSVTALWPSWMVPGVTERLTASGAP